MVIFDGDPKIVDTGDGPQLIITDGQPTMDEGLENAVYLSLFGLPKWWGNIISVPSEQYNSRIFDIINGKLTAKTIVETGIVIKEALAWMISDGIAKKIDVEAAINAINNLYIKITIQQPDRNSIIKYQINWDTMAVRVGAK